MREFYAYVCPVCGHQANPATRCIRHLPGAVPVRVEVVPRSAADQLASAVEMLHDLPARLDHEELDGMGNEITAVLKALTEYRMFFDDK